VFRINNYGLKPTYNFTTSTVILYSSPNFEHLANQSLGKKSSGPEGKS
jgi:hypothetical protein